MTGFAIVSTTVASEGKAVALARALVEAKLAACVQMTPVTSIYRWEGKTETAQERVLTCKIVASRFDEVAEAISANHDYEVPEIVMFPIDAASPTYTAWLRAETAV